MVEKKKVVEFKEQAYEVETQTPTITDESIIEARRLIGVDLRVGRATVEITKETIRQHCNMLDCTNPLFLDEEYARKTRWGGIIAPPTLSGQAGNAIFDTGLRGVHGFHCGEDWEWFQVVRPGDVLISRARPIDAIEHRGRTAARMIEQITKREIRNQWGELVVRAWFHVMRVPRARSGQGLSYEPRVQKWSDEELARLEAEIDVQQVRGATPRYWEDAPEGEEMAPIVLGPLRNVEIAFAGGVASEGDGAFVYPLLRRRRHPADTYVDPATGVQDHPHRGHWEAFMAREAGMPGIYDLGVTRTALMARYVFDWMGDDAFLKKVWTTLRRPRVLGDVVWAHGKVVRKWTEGEEHLVECEMNMVNQLGEKNAVGRAVVLLPSRGS